jgi:hypothetical protein
VVQHLSGHPSLSTAFLKSSPSLQQLLAQLFSMSWLLGAAFLEQHPSRQPSLSFSLTGLNSAHLSLASSSEQHDLAHFLDAASLLGLPTEQHDLVQLSLTDGCLADLTLLVEPFRKRRRFSAAFSFATEPVLQQESVEVRIREREDDFLEHCLVIAGRPLVSQQDS